MIENENKITNYVIIFQILSIILSILLTNEIITIDIYSYFLYLALLTNTVLITYGIKHKYYKVDNYYYIIFLLVLFEILSTIFAIKIDISILGNVGRREGLLSLITYYSIFLLVKNIKNKENINKIIDTILMLGIINIIYGIIEVVPILSKIFAIKNAWIYAKGTFGNSNFYGTYMLILSLLSIGLYLKDKKYISFVIIYTFGVLLSGCMGCILSYILLFIIIIAFNIKNIKENIKKYLLIFLAFILSIIIVTNLPGNEVIKDTLELKNEINNTLKDGLKEEYGTNRIYIWKNTLQKIPENILTGVGIDNFMYAFNPALETLDYHLVVGKAHNEYLQRLITEGIFSFLTYMFLLIYIFINGLKTIKKDNYYIPFMLVFIGYLSQAMFNISVIRIAPLFYICMGFLVKETK